MRDLRHSYTVYSIGCGIVWATVLAVLSALDEREKLRRILPVFGGWWLGWTSATIARSVYPPPGTRGGLRSRRALAARGRGVRGRPSTTSTSRAGPRR